MLIYEGIKREFIDSVVNDTIATEIEAKLLLKMKRHTAKSESRAFVNSMEYMYKVLNYEEIPDDVGIAIEYNIPTTSKRVDFIISGYNLSKQGVAVIVELKQWEEIKLVEGKDALVETYTGGALRNVVHPSYQAWSYSTLIQDYNESVQLNHIDLQPCAYLHNYKKIENDPIEDAIYREYIEMAPVFTKGDVVKLRGFIRRFITYGDNKENLYLIDHGKIKPSKSLQDSLSNMMKGNKEFIMLDDQKVIYEEILEIAKQSKRDHKKRVYIAKGGPGTGKSVIAINLLSELTKEDQFCQYVSKNSAPRNVYAAKLKGTIRKTNIDNLFKGPGIYMEAEANIVDTILADEAHRLNEKSGMFHNLGDNQIKEIIQASKCSVFFIDEHQRVTIRDNGSIAEIKKWAEKLGAEVYENELTSQFRCNGSSGYLAWLDNVLQISETANLDLEGSDYTFEVIDDPNELKHIIFDYNKVNNRSRILAGYCWNWLKIEQNNKEYNDIVINDFKMSWNLGNTSTFAIDEDSVEEAGCIHTSQGLEFDYSGVIIGEDMRYENGQIITDYTKRAQTDQSLKGIKKIAKENPQEAAKIADEIIKNTYRTLLTRGMKGCYVYCVDKGLQEYLKESIEKISG